jgi:hypothetical protein
MMSCFVICPFFCRCSHTHPLLLLSTLCVSFLLSLLLLQAVDTILDAMCAYKLRGREPFLAIGGGVVLDIAGMAACLYRHGVPFVRVPTTLLAIVDASVGVKNGVDYCCCVTDETYKNRVGSFYAPARASWTRRSSALRASVMYLTDVGRFSSWPSVLWICLSSWKLTATPC